MTDFTMCARDGCPLGPTCRRNILVSKPRYMQPWAELGPAVGGECSDLLALVPAQAAMAVEKGMGA